MKKSKKRVPHYQYFSTSLTNIILAWSRNFMIKKDWEVLSVDKSRDVVVFRRFQSTEESE